MSFSVSDHDDIDFIMNVQHQLINHDDRNIQDDRWNSKPKPRAPGRWMSESSLCLNEPPRRPRKNHREPGRWESDSNLSRTKSHMEPPRRPTKCNVEQKSTEESRWKDCLPMKTSSFVLTKPTRRESLGLSVEEIHEKMASMNCQPRWKDCLPVKSSSFVLTKPTRRESLGLSVEEINEMMASMNCQPAVSSNHSRGPVTHAAITA